MTYSTIESSPAEGSPYYLYQFVEGEQIWRFTSRATTWTSAASGGTEITWEPAAVAHGDVVQTSEIERGRLEMHGYSGVTLQAKNLLSPNKLPPYS